MQPSRLLLASALLVAACGSTSPAPPPPPRPEIAVDPATCEARAETIAAIDGTGATTLDAMAVASDGTVYFSRYDQRELAGLYALDPGGGAPRRISPSSSVEFANRLWIDGDSILVAGFGIVYRVPRAGGDAAQIGAIPDALTAPGPLSSAHAFDGAYVYVGAMTFLHGGGQKNDVWRIPKSGGDAQLLFTSNDAQYNGLWNAAIAFDDTSLYLGASAPSELGDGVLMKMPKTGGTPVVLHTNAYDSLVNALVLTGTDLYAPPLYGKLTRWPLDPSAPSTVIESDGYVNSLIGDGAGTYVALRTPDPNAKSFAERVAIVRVPNGVEHTTSIGCTDARRWFVRSMGLDATHVYALAWDDDLGSDSNRYEILRVPR
jgi:hypothetical protein